MPQHSILQCFNCLKSPFGLKHQQGGDGDCANDMEEEKERSEYRQSQTSKKICPAGNPRKERAGRACEPAQNEL
jgi:hypothetical protein